MSKNALRLSVVGEDGTSGSRFAPQGSSVCSQTHNGSWFPRSPRKTALQLQSLRLANDPQYKEMQHYNMKDSSHFERLVNGQGSGLGQSVATLDPDAVPKESIQGRAQWQNSFDQTVKRLLVDFELSEEPSCRLNHLGRMHDWFVTHGGKQTRKERKPPNFIRLDHNDPLPPGSARNWSSSSNRSSSSATPRTGQKGGHLSLAGSMAMSRTNGFKQ